MPVVLKMKKVFILILLGLFLSACASYSKNDQPAHPEWTRLGEKNRLGQSFTASYDGLNEISVFLKASPDTTGELSLSLSQGKDQEQVIGSASINSK